MDNEFDKKTEYAKYRLERSKEEYETAIDMLDAKHFRAANNRAYYSIFHGMRSVLALDGFDSRKHSGIISFFRKEYIKTGIFESGLSDIIGEAFEIRNASDYDDMYLATEKEAREQVERAGQFYDAISAYVINRLENTVG